MFRGLHLIAAALLLVPFAARAGEDRVLAQKPFDDAEFVAKAASGGMFEVELGKVADTRAKSDSVKKFGERMVADHGKASEALKKAAKAAGLTVPEKMNDENQKEFDRFKDYKGENFDRDYITTMVADHEADLADFTRASKEAKNPAIKDFATKALPVVKAHLELAKKLQKEVK
jgi:putative membrane protein